MAVVADLGVDVEVVEEDERLRQRVRVRRDLLAEERQARIAVAAWHITEDLIVGTVLADDVEDVLDRRGLADHPRNRRIDRGAGRSQFRRVLVRRQLVDALRIRLQRGIVGGRDLRDRALEQLGDVLAVGPAKAGLRTARVGGGRQALAVEHVDPLPFAIERDRGRIPPGRDEALDVARGAVGDVDDGDGVVVGVGDEEGRTVGRAQAR